MSRNATPATTAADHGAVCWPEPSPLEHWWTEIMDGVTPAGARATVPGDHSQPIPPTCREPA